MDNWDFPQYRKYSNNKVFFKINSFEEFEELNLLLGKQLTIVNAKIHPDRVRIIDMLDNNGGFWVLSSEEEWVKSL